MTDDVATRFVRCPCVDCRWHGRTLPTEWFIARVREREALERLRRRAAA